MLFRSDEDDKTIIAAKVNNRIRELSYEVYFDAEIEFLTTKDYDAVKIYETSLRYLVAMAMDRLYPGVEIHFSYSISRSIYMEILDKNIIVDEKLVLRLVKELDSLIDRNLPFKRKIVSNDQAAEFYQNNPTFQDKLAILKYRPEKTVQIGRAHV